MDGESSYWQPEHGCVRGAWKGCQILPTVEVGDTTALVSDAGVASIQFSQARWRMRACRFRPHDSGTAAPEDRTGPRSLISGLSESSGQQLRCWWGPDALLSWRVALIAAPSVSLDLRFSFSADFRIPCEPGTPGTGASVSGKQRKKCSHQNLEATTAREVLGTKWVRRSEAVLLPPAAVLEHQNAAGFSQCSQRTSIFSTSHWRTAPSHISSGAAAKATSSQVDILNAACLPCRPARAAGVEMTCRSPGVAPQ